MMSSPCSASKSALPPVATSTSLTDDAAVDAALDRQALDEIAVVTEHQAVFGAGLDPVVAFAADDEVLRRRHRAPKSSPWPSRISSSSPPPKTKSRPVSVMIRLMPWPPLTTSSPAPERISSSPNWSVMMSLPSPPKMKSLPIAALEAVVAAVTPQRVVAHAADQAVVAFGATEHDVLRRR